MTLADIKEHGIWRDNGNRTGVENWVHCKDGFAMSVIAGIGTYCTPQPGPDYDSNDAVETVPYTHAEVGFPNMRPEPWEKWEPYCESHETPHDTVYAYVPFEMIEALVALHGGEVGH